MREAVGTDGGTGLATDPAGAIIDETTLDCAKALGLDACAFLDANNSTRPTFTNVSDLRIVLVDR